MSHYITLVESAPGRIDKLIDKIKDTELSDGSHPNVREVKLIDIQLQEKDEKEFFEDKGFATMFDTGHVGDRTLDKLSKWISRLTNMKKFDVNTNMNTINTEFETWTDDNGFVYAWVLGRMPDEKREDGLEMI